jgi:MYXO-CTERM domain-containing protein
MRKKQRIPSAVRRVALAAALAAVSAQAGATLVADGKFDAAEGYQLGLTFGILNDVGVTSYGKLYFGNAADGQYLYIQMPLGFVDNTYGTNAASDWGPAGGHTFDNLLNSDALSISFGGNTLKMDYLADCGTAGTSPCGPNSQYRSGGGGTGVTGGAGASTGSWSAQEGSYSGTAAGKASLKEIATSLEYNLNNGFASATTNSSTNAAWIKEVGYEIQFAAGTFNASDWVNKDKAPGLITLNNPGDVYPSKKTFEKYTTPSCTYGCTPLPEPGTNWLLGLGALSLLWVARRRRDAVAPNAIRRLVS